MRPDGEYICLLIRFRNRIWHWHWPKEGILQCTKAAEELNGH